MQSAQEFPLFVMLKIRVIPTLLWNGRSLVKGVAFDSWRVVASPMQSIRVYDLREVDELVFLDIVATKEGRSPDFSLIDELADWCFVPFSVGGGIRSSDDVRNLLRAGADKVVINTLAAEHPEMLRPMVEQFGSQCIVVSIDARRKSDGTCEAFTHAGTVATGKTPERIARDAEAAGAGEILITSIDRDGTLSGYDVDLTRSISEAVRIPVIASGGAGSYTHMEDVLREGGASAVAASAMYQFTHQTPLEAKLFLRSKGFAVRI